MFGSGKVYPKPKKAKRQHGAPFYIIGTFTFAIEFMLGVNAAFLVFQSIHIVTQQMLEGTPLQPIANVISLIASLAVGFCFVFGGMWVFGGFMSSLQDAQAYEEEYGTNTWPRVMVWALFVAVILLDFTTLCFRATFFAEKGAFALFCFFVLLIFMPPILGPLIHVLENTPRDRRLTKARQYLEALESDDVMNAVETMDPDLRSRYLEGDAAALEEHYERTEQMRLANWEYEQEQMRANQERANKHNRPLPTSGKRPFLQLPFRRAALNPNEAPQSGKQRGA